MIVLIGGTKGGGGKTTVAVNLAIQLAKENHNNDKAVFLMDADIQGSAINWIGTRMSNQHTPEVRCAKRNTKESAGELAQSIKKLNDTYQYVLVDSGGYDGPSFRAVLTVCDLLVFPVQPTQLDLWAIENTLELVDLAKGFNPDIKMLAVLSRCSTMKSSSDADSAREYIANMNIPIASTVIKNRVSYQRCASEGKGVVEFNDPKAKDEILSLTKEILNVQI